MARERLTISKFTEEQIRKILNDANTQEIL